MTQWYDEPKTQYAACERDAWGERTYKGVSRKYVADLLRAYKRSRGAVHRTEYSYDYGYQFGTLKIVPRYIVDRDRPMMPPAPVGTKVTRSRSRRQSR